MPVNSRWVHRISLAGTLLLRSLPGLALGLLGAGCYAGVQLPHVPPPSAIPALEARLAERADDVEGLVRLGAAYLAASRPEEALPVLAKARDLDPTAASPRFFMGMGYADLGRYAEAIESFESFAVDLPAGPARDQLRARVRLLRRAELRAAVREAIELEGEIGARAPPDASTVAVFPFLFESPEETLRPLSRALADMLSTDLAQSSRVRVLERLRLQALFDEVSLGETDLVDPRTAARGGRLIGAAQIVQGRMQGATEQLRLEAAVIAVEKPEEALKAIEEVDALEQLFDMETRIAFRIFEELGIALTAAERERISQRPTENLQALLAYGRGLEADDAGRYADAAEYFALAATLDPDFEEARTESIQAGAAAEAVTNSAEGLIDLLDVEWPEIDLGVDAVLEQAGERDPAQEALGSEGIGDLVQRIRIIFPRPGGGP